MNLQDVLYNYEHRVLPTNFYKYKSDFIALILKRKDVLYKVLSDIFDEEGVDNPYSEEDFNLEILRADETLLVVQITFPEPMAEPLCYCSYLFVDKELENLKFFCVEKGTGIGGSQKYICSWSAEGEHLNYGSYDLEANEGYLKCQSIYENC